MCTGRNDGSNRVIFFTPDVAARMARQEVSLPMPLGLTTPRPVMTTRFIVAPKVSRSPRGIVKERRQSPRSHRIQNRMTLGLYISVPFCQTKCSYCNFASDVFSKAAYEGYVARVLEDIADAQRGASKLGCILPETVDSIYLGGGTPSILNPEQLKRIFGALRERFAVASDAEVTVECAPGTLSPVLIDTLLECGVNRVSLGVQSFIDQEAQSVGRLHKRAILLEEIARLRTAGLDNINVDLIAGLHHQTAQRWTFSLNDTIAIGVPHAS